MRLLSSDNPSTSAEPRALCPLEKLPVLQAEGRTLVESSIIEWLDSRHATGERLIPADPDVALEVRMLDHIFDNYVMAPMMTIVFDRLRPEAVRDPHGVGLALIQGASDQPSEAFNQRAPGHGNWHELHTTDPDGAFDFYAGQFGWTRGRHANGRDGHLATVQGGWHRDRRNYEGA